MKEPIDHEVEAIKAVLTALSPLSEKARSSVLEYVVKRLDVSMSSRGEVAGETGRIAAASTPELQETVGSIHIKDLEKEKKPRSANEMAALIAFYLANIVSPGERKSTVNQKDIEAYFKIAVFPLPEQVRATLPNAKAAGYFDSVGGGEYRLNAVGYNLVAHSMPRGKQPRAARKPSGTKIRKKRPKRQRKSRSS